MIEVFFGKEKLKSFIIDNQDYELVMRFHWSQNNNGHVRTNLPPSPDSERYSNGRRKRKGLLLSRLLLGVVDPKIKVDHKDRNPLNNTRDNLRICTQLNNTRNKSKLSRNTSGFIGVYKHKPTNTWMAYIGIGGKLKNLGHFKDIEVAARCRDNKAKELYGEFAVLNFN